MVPERPWWVDKVALVSGAGGGIGRATIRHLAGLGATVVGCDLPGRGGDDATEGLAGADGRYHSIDADISDESQVGALFASALDRCGRLDLLVNVAAVTGAGLDGDTNIVDMDLATWDHVVNVNLRGTMLMCRAAVAVMIERGGGSIVNISSRARPAVVNDSAPTRRRKPASTS